MTTQSTQKAGEADAANIEATPTRKRARIIGLDGVRGLLCLSIAITHVTGYYTKHTAEVWKTNVFGFSLVYFFVLSGFLLFLPTSGMSLQNARPRGCRTCAITQCTG